MEKAAAQGDKSAQEQIGLFYLTGRGVAKDSAKSIEWLQKSSAQGLPEAQADLGGYQRRKGRNPLIRRWRIQ